MLTVDAATLDALRADGFDDLLVENFAETGMHDDVSPLAVNWPAYYGLERSGVLRSFALRRGGRLIGYTLFFLQPTLHSRRTVWAVNDLIWVRPDERRGRAGVTLIRRSEQLLREAGARVILYASKPDLSNKHGYDSVGRLFAKLGYGPFDHSWSKEL